MKKLLYTLGLVCLVAACSEDYTDWADPQSNPSEEPSNVELAVEPAAAVDFATVEAETLQLFVPTVTAEEGTTTTYEAILANADGSRTIKIATDENGYALTEEVQAAVESLYGRRPVERIIPVTVIATSTLNSVSVRTQAETTFSATPNAPEIEDAYYLTGSLNGWNNSDTTYELSNGGVDPYENPVFTCTIPAGTGDIEFKVTPKSGLGGDWSKCLTASDVEGKFATNNVGGNLKITAVEGARYYRLTFDMMEQTWSYEALAFSNYIYEIGNETSWGTAHALYSPNADGIYQGYYFLNGEFKFKPNENDWNGDWEYDGDNRIADNGGGNCPGVNPGFYQVDVNLQEMTYAVTEVKSITIVGSHNGWNPADEAMHMTYNQSTGAWEAPLSLNDDAVVKFAMNDDWAVSWGGANGDPTAYDNLTQYGGKDLEVKAGTYSIELYISYEGKNRVVLNKF